MTFERFPLRELEQMKLLAIISMFFSLMACDPLDKGYKKNPAFVLDEAFKAIQNLDKRSFREVAAKEALCLYGNDNGLEHLKANLDFKLEEVDVIPKLQLSRYFLYPIYVGYWSYYQERYEIEILHRTHKEIVIHGIVDCDFGTNEQKNDRLINQKPTKYKMKECTLVKIVPKSFPVVPEATRCRILNV
jgi:hypothetical protein